MQIRVRHVCFPLATLTAVWLSTGCRHGPGAPREGEWLHWRGPHYNGSSPATNLPAHWCTKEHVAWSARLPGRGANTPIVTADRIFLTAECDGYALMALCLDRASGRKLWKRQLGTGHELAENDCATPSAVTDGTRVFFMFGSGLLAATDLDGHVLWHRDLEDEYGPFNIRFGFSASPLLCEGRLFVAVIQGDFDNQEPTEADPATASYLLAMDAASGKTLWKQPRPCDAHGEGQEGYASPIPRQGRHGTEIVLTGGDCVTAHDPGTGVELWRWKGYNEERNPVGRIIPSPVMVKDMVIACSPQNAATFAFRPESAETNDVAKVAWIVDGGPDVTTPLHYMGMLYFVKEDDQIIVAVDVHDGEIAWIGELKLGGVARASLTGADGKIYGMSDTGDIVVLEAGRTFNVLAEFAVGRHATRATIVAAGQDLYIRTDNRLFAVRKHP